MNAVPKPFASAVTRRFDAAVASLRPSRLNRDTFEAWHSSGVPIDVSAAQTLEEAEAITSVASSHKCQFAIQHTTQDARRFLHFYNVTKSPKKGRWRESRDGGPKVFEGNLEPKLLMSMQVLAPLQPVQPWQWSDGDRTGSKHGICPDLVGGMIVVQS